MEQNHLCNVGRGYYEEQFCEIILNWEDQGHVVQEEMPFEDISYLELWRPFRLAERKHVCHILVEGIKRNNSVKLF